MFHKRKFPTKTLFPVILFAFFAASFTVSAQDRYLIESQSPYVPDPWNIEVIPLASIESGDIPTVMMKPQLGFCFFGLLHLSAAPTMVYLLDTEDFLFTSWEASLRFRLPFSQDLPFEFFLYTGIHHTFAEPFAVPYEGDLPLVHTVISPYTDTGIDIIGGMSGVVSFTLGPLNAGVMFSADYARTIGRTYNPLFDEEGYKNRIFLNGVPTIFLALGKSGKAGITVAMQNRFTFWFERGFMYDILPQGVLSLGPAISFILGGTIPMVGGGVYKLYAGAKVTINPKTEVRIVVRDIHFPPNKAILYGPQNEKAEENRRIIQKLYEQLLEYPEYKIVVEGHTSFVHWDDPVKGPIEQKEELIPLSYARANSVMEALIALGMPRERMTAVGKGGTEPVVPFKKINLQWKNRRVEIYLHK